MEGNNANLPRLGNLGQELKMETVNIESINSAGIESEMEMLGIDEIEFLGSFLPEDQHLNASDADARIRIYRFPNGFMVADTNGDPVWEAQDQTAWDELMEEYNTGL